VDLCATYTVHLRLTGKLLVDFLSSYSVFFPLGVTDEAIRTNSDWKSTFFEAGGQFRPNFHVYTPSPVEHFYTNIYALYNFVADSSLFTERNFVANFLLQKCKFRMKLSHFIHFHFRTFALSHFRIL